MKRKKKFNVFQTDDLLPISNEEAVKIAGGSDESILKAIYIAALCIGALYAMDTGAAYACKSFESGAPLRITIARAVGTTVVSAICRGIVTYGSYKLALYINKRIKDNEEKQPEWVSK